MIQLFRTDRFKMLENSTCYVEAGTHANCAGKVSMTILIEPIDTPELELAWAENPNWQRNPNSAPDVPRALVDDDYKRYIDPGARRGCEENGITGGYRFTLIDAYLHPPDWQSTPFQRASYVAVVKWLDHQGLSTVAIQHETE